MNEAQVGVVTVFWFMANCLLTGCVAYYVQREMLRIVGLTGCFMLFFLLFFWAAGTGAY